MSGKDYILQIKVRNGPLLRAMRAAGFTAADLSRASGAGQSRIGEYLSLKRAPMLESGEWRADVLRISATLKILPENLFPPQHLRQPLHRGQVELETSRAALVAETTFHAGAIEHRTPETDLEQKQLDTDLRKLLELLTPRQQFVLSKRFALDGREEQSLEEIGQQLGGLHRERVRQIEAKALRKLAIQAKDLACRHGVRLHMNYDAPHAKFMPPVDVKPQGDESWQRSKPPTPIQRPASAR